MKTLVLCAFILVGLAAAEIPNNGRGIGWRNQTDGQFPDATPPLGFAEGKLQRWKVEMPNWSNASPIIVDDAVYVLSEPVESSRPILQRLDVATGKEVWRLELDPADASRLPEGEKEKMSNGFNETCRFVGDLGEYAFGNATIEALRAKTPEDPGVKAYDELVARRGLARWPLPKDGGQGMTGKITIPNEIIPSEMDPRAMAETWFKNNCFMPCWANLIYCTKGKWTMENIQGWMGATFATPLWDGEKLYVLSNYNILSAISAQGKTVWQVGFPMPKFCYPRSTWAYAMSSPFVADGRIIVQSGEFLRAVDRANGTTVWEQQLENFARACNWVGGYANPLEVEGTVCILACDGAVYRAKDGKKLIDGLGGEGQPINKTSGPKMVTLEHIAATRGDTVFFGSRSTSYKSVRLIFAGPDQLKAETVWENKTMMAGGYNALAALADNLLVSHGGSVDIATGKPGMALNGGGGHPGMCAAFVGNQWVFLGHGDATKGAKSSSFKFYDVKTGKSVVSTLAADPAASLELKRKRWRAGGWYPAWGWSNPFFAGKAMIIRSYDHLYCFAKD